MDCEWMRDGGYGCDGSVPPPCFAPARGTGPTVVEFADPEWRSTSYLVHQPQRPIRGGMGVQCSQSEVLMAEAEVVVEQEPQRKRQVVSEGQEEPPIRV